MTDTAPSTLLERRPVRVLDVAAGDAGALADAIESIYAARHDVVVVRAAFDARVLAAAGERLDNDDAAWARPNVTMAIEDVRLLGTDTPATPTFRDPRGATLDAYLASAARHAGAASSPFEAGYDAGTEILRVLERCAGGRPVALLHADDGRAFVPYTIRRLVEGTQIGLHHDYHYRLDLYRDLAPRLDTGTLVSFVATLRRPQAGGELFVYGATSDDPAVPRLPNGFAYDLAAVEARYDHVRLDLHEGDLFLLAAGRCLHRVGRIGGARARITMGGFLALDRARENVLYWS